MAGDIIVWADIPVADLDRAIAFYEHVLQLKVPIMPGAKDVAVMTPASSEAPAVSADLYIGKPSADDPTVYFGTGGDMDGMMKRVAEAGGTVVQEKSFMGPMMGWIGYFVDSEGNRMGLQQPAD